MSRHGIDVAPLVNAELHSELSAFLAYESELVDSRRFHEWVMIVDPSFTYRVPVPLTPDNPSKNGYDDSAFVIDESRQTLIDHWFVRFEPEMWEMAWAENPPVRYRHFVTNVRVRETEVTDVYDVRSNVMVSAARQSSPTSTLHAERFDVVAREEDGLRLRSRFVVTDESVLDFVQLRVVF
jgi:3-phenylpropionate/cinnamic acid dioxygenase small subunit